MSSPTPFKSWLDASRIWFDVGWRYSEMMFASAQVIALRSDLMRRAGASSKASDHAEFSLMKQEKVEAAAESVQAMALASLLEGQRYAAFAFAQFLRGLSAWVSLAFPGTYQQVSARQLNLVRNTLQDTALSTNKVSAATARIARRGLAPIRKRAGANARRLKAAR